MAQNFTRAALFGLCATSFSGCMTKRNGYDVPEIPLPAQYKNAVSKNAPASASTAAASKMQTAASNAKQGDGLVEWWLSFGNQELVDLIDRGLANNPDLRIATEQMAEAKTRVDQARAGLLPSLSVPIQIANQAPGGSIGIITPGSGTASQKTYQAGLMGSWRLDAWGERSSLAESAKFQLWQAAFNRDNVQRNMTASLASSYIEYLTLNDRLRLARETESVLSRMLDSIEKRVNSGDATLIELDQQKAAIFSVRGTIPTLEQQREDALTSIAFLVGSVPGSLSLSNDGLDSLELPDVVPSLPSSLLLRRPDVRMAEARLLAADADVDVARARILPPVDLSAQVGHSSLTLAQFFEPSTLFWNAIANITVSIFDGGKLKSDKENAQAVHEEMVETYARTIYQAAKEVESALAAIRLTGDHLTEQQEAAMSARRAWDNSAKVYAVGELDYQTLLDAERNYHHYLDDYLRIKMDSFHGYINLFQALGGGVNFVGKLPGKGARPTSASEEILIPEPHTASNTNTATDGINWADASVGNVNNKLPVEKFWQVELPGLYPRTTVGATWHDLRTRYPKLMDGRVVRPLLNGTIDKNADDQMSLFRLYVGKFSTQESAQELCEALKTNYQRCRVVSSHLEESVATPGLSQKKAVSSTISDSTQALDVGRLPAEANLSDASSPIKSGADADRTKTDSEPALSSPSKLNVAAVTHEVANGATHSSPIVKRLNNHNSKVAYSIQLGAFSTLQNAKKSQAQWQNKGYVAYVYEIMDDGKKPLFAVRTGIFVHRYEASTFMRTLERNAGFKATLVTAELEQPGNPAMTSISNLPEINIEGTHYHPAKVTNDG
ncbi:MAG: efflux transporter outer membrane subunit [Nitrosomonadales bacterium]